MLGTYRLILALLVALSHADVRIAGLNPGVISVVGFYLISGYVMTGLLRTHYRGVARLPHFYLDRILRLFPQYLLIAGLTLTWYFTAGKTTAFLRHAPAISDILANLSVVPLNYFMFNGTDQFTLLPPAWSLGAEIQFYLLMPLLLWWRVRWLAFLLAIMVFLAAAWGWLNTDYYGYRLLPGVLVFFLIGSALFDLSGKARRAGRFSLMVVVLAVGVALVLVANGHLGLPYNRETLLGVCLGVSILCLFGPMRQRGLDNRLGDLSYGVFLNHFLLQWAILGVPKGGAEFTLYIVMSIGLSYLTQRWIEQPVLRWRRNLRKRRSLLE